ncbi:hypothetical protein UY286_04710 [Paenibacillus polymyxa]|nr:hypothetical protein [Paenibacillus polymyxa]MDY8116739.1 hypothetical protein [Paenibacillus polymyxa]
MAHPSAGKSLGSGHSNALNLDLALRQFSTIHIDNLNDTTDVLC